MSRQEMTAKIKKKEGAVMSILITLLIIPFWKAAHAACDLGDDKIMTSWRGNFSSPGWVENATYPTNQNCRWTIIVNGGSRINLTFHDFQLEPGFTIMADPASRKLNCTDRVTITDGEEVNSSCGTLWKGQSFVSKGNKLVIEFYSDESEESKGFMATYEATTGLCESNISSPDILESPPEGIRCTWRIMSNSSRFTYIHPVGNGTTTTLPSCDISPLTWKTSVNENGHGTQICNMKSIIVTQSEVIITYDPQSPHISWTGRLQIEFITNTSCHLFCRNYKRCISSRSLNKVDDYRCDCEEGYRGSNCEVFVDPCANVTCANGGTCVVSNATVSCTCPAGFDPTDCRLSSNHCLSAPCQNGGTCINREENFDCQCPSTHTGTQCSIPLGKQHCKEERDSTPGSGIKWADTLAGNYDTEPCPSGTQGNATRNCLENDQSQTQGLWTRPDLSNCVSRILLDLYEASRALAEPEVPEEVLHNVTRRLAIVTSALKHPNNSTLYPGDLLISTDILENISKGVENVQSLELDTLGLVSNFTSAVDNIIDSTTLDMWKNARVELVEAKIISLIASTQRFAENVVHLYQDSVIMKRDDSLQNHTSTVLYAFGDNLDLVVSEWEESGSLSPLTTWQSGKQQSAIILPPEIVSFARRENPDGKIKVCSSRFTSLTPLLSLKEYRFTQEEDLNTTKILNSDVVSAEVLDLPNSIFSKLTNPVQITFPLTDPSRRQDLDKVCVFMNMTTSNATERWLSEGCFAALSNSTHVMCHCYHLTNFALLLDVYQNENIFDEENSAALSYISYIGGSLSILACVVVIAVFEFFRIRSARIRIHEQLALSIIAVQVLFLIGVGPTASQEHTPEWACKLVAILLHYFLTAQFCWMLVEGLHIYVLLVQVFKRGSYLVKYCVIGWGIPFVIVGVSVGVFYDKYGDGSLCWLNHELLLIFFVPTVCIVIVINTVILILVLKVMLKSIHSTAKAKSEHQSGVRISLKASAVLLPLLGLTWTFGFLTVETGDSHIMTYIFTYLFTITNSCQGVMFFVFHCLLNGDVHNAYERRYKQKKKTVSSLETTTRKQSEVSTYMADNSPGKSTTKKSFLDMSVVQKQLSNNDNNCIGSNTDTYLSEKVDSVNGPICSNDSSGYSRTSSNAFLDGHVISGDVQLDQTSDTQQTLKQA